MLSSVSYKFISQTLNTKGATIILAMQHRQLHYSVARNGQRTISLIFVFNTFSLQHRQLRLGSGRQDWVAVSVPSLVFLSLWTSLHRLSTASAATIRLRGTGETEFDAGFISRFFFWASSAWRSSSFAAGRGFFFPRVSFSSGHFSIGSYSSVAEGRVSFSLSFSSGHLQHRQLQIWLRGGGILSRVPFLLGIFSIGSSSFG